MNNPRRLNMQSKIDSELLTERDSQIALREKEIARLKSLLQRTLPYVTKMAQLGSHDAELLQVEIESAK